MESTTRSNLVTGHHSSVIYTTLDLVGAMNALQTITAEDYSILQRFSGYGVINDKKPFIGTIDQDEFGLELKLLRERAMMPGAGPFNRARRVRIHGTMRESGDRLAITLHYYDFKVTAIGVLIIALMAVPLVLFGVQSIILYFSSFPILSIMVVGGVLFVARLINRSRYLKAVNYVERSITLAEPAPARRDGDDAENNKLGTTESHRPAVSDAKSIAILGYRSMAINASLTPAQLYDAIEHDIAPARPWLAQVFIPIIKSCGPRFGGTITCSGFRATYLPAAHYNVRVRMQGTFEPQNDGTTIHLRIGSIIGGVARILIVLGAAIGAALLTIDHMHTSNVLLFIILWLMAIAGMIYYRGRYGEACDAALEIISTDLARAEGSGVSNRRTYSEHHTA